MAVLDFILGETHGDMIVSSVGGIEGDRSLTSYTNWGMLSVNEAPKLFRLCLMFNSIKFFITCIQK